MRQTIYFSLLLIFSLTLFNSCQKESHRAFYYWKTTFQLSKAEKKALQTLEIKKLYIRFFDIVWNETNQQIEPLATINFLQQPDSLIEIIPVIYITNQAAKHLPTTQAKVWAKRIFNHLNKITTTNHIHYKEIQIDCDWSGTTRANYFAYLTELKTLLHTPEKTLSATIRLHQVKYRNRTGVPPIDRGMLMYYNMGKLDGKTTKNSIYDPSIAAKYINSLDTYPVELDVALPAFSWGVHSRNEKVIGLLSNLNNYGIYTRPEFKAMGNSVFVAQHSFFSNGTYFRNGDFVKVEKVSPKDCLQAAKQLEGKLPNNQRSISIYHLDSLILSHYEIQQLETIYSVYR